MMTHSIPEYRRLQIASPTNRDPPTNGQVELVGHHDTAEPLAVTTYFKGGSVHLLLELATELDAKAPILTQKQSDLSSFVVMQGISSHLISLLPTKATKND